MAIRESGQDYLETILILYTRKGIVHSVDIAEEMGYSKASISVAMRALQKDGFICMNPNRSITLTASGRALAEQMYERHLLLSEWLEALGVDKKTAARDACKMEHDLSVESFEAIKRHVLSHCVPQK